MIQKVITNQETLAIYFHQVNERHPQSVLDIGMVLKRLGTVSRQARGNEISKDLLLCGIDYFSQFHMEVYHKVYNTILSRGQFLNCLLTLPAFDMVVLLEMDEILDREEEDIIWEAYIIPNVNGVLTDVEIAKRQYEAGRIFSFDILSTGQQSYAWVSGDDMRGGV